ncbi:uncharacterized protein A4U43_C01F27690 [Asparagus officinalis]|uniref:non-specific serine/threonine protein kinase n=1 Tax=Asparagus officinalis TaxID=4686 RepID=A0A5P1FWK8_ASPOF|nr:uncharacterized protein A4U43_C01F27690 [Asparagus officinalis]
MADEEEEAAAEGAARLPMGSLYEGAMFGCFEDGGGEVGRGASIKLKNDASSGMSVGTRMWFALETGNCDELVDPRLQGNYNKIEMFTMIETAAACVRHSAPKRPRMVQVVRSLDCQAFNSDQYSADIQKFRRMAFDNGNGYEFDSGEYDR